jgi:hypothetical protein
MGAFLLCWLPFFTWYLTVAICGDTYCPCPGDNNIFFNPTV